MSDTKWTREPWHAGECSTPPFNPGVFANMQIVAEVRVRLNLDKKEASANADLIAAAPELYEVLYALLEDIEGSEEDRVPVSKRLRSDAIKALAKARGETCAS